jgi:hypothetical protein
VSWQHLRIDWANCQDKQSAFWILRISGSRIRFAYPGYRAVSSAAFVYILRKLLQNTSKNGDDMKRLISNMAMAVPLLALGGCATWSTSSVDTSRADAKATATASKAASEIILTDADIVDRKYQSLGDIAVTVNKTTVFHPDPTREMVNEKLREKGAELGADAVILVRYGNGGISLMSWGSLEGKGRAIKFVQ